MGTSGFKASLRPMFPKQTQLQKRTLMIQIPHSIVSCEMK
jgi:hypothetical protein